VEPGQKRLPTLKPLDEYMAIVDDISVNTWELTVCNETNNNINNNNNNIYLLTSHN